jgi:hypothetical protein
LNRVYARTFKIATQNPGVTGLFSVFAAEFQFLLCQMNKRNAEHPSRRSMTGFHAAPAGRASGFSRPALRNILLFGQGVTN